ncbi:EF-P lysine aminoacylase EpmA [Gilvimarinus polysaccharolyticus]|uniref:EF-P lysine aminoacylase EpmA n=1 Tax=Gilvimarinus polysaccharolyticus TaxID=863921 RepID=UPI0006737E57|nr:EF-P lysine aminoacylase EpmA [Gilvimarinus polysaccharolyticus]
MSDIDLPSCSPALLQARADLNYKVREFFRMRQVLEVEVPILASSFVTDPFIEPVTARNAGQTYYLQSSPEYAMKRLLADCQHCIYALTKVFRAGEHGSRHNPEFTMLEWYRVGLDDHALMAEVGDLVTQLMAEVVPQLSIYKLSYRQWFTQRWQIDPHTIALADLRALGKSLIEIDDTGLDKDAWLDLLVTHELEPSLPVGLTFVYDFPASQAALARIVNDEQGTPVARRFEAYLASAPGKAMELANGYWELTCAQEQRQRFDRDLARRRALGLPGYPVDERLLGALARGIPTCAGVALGVDRLLMQQQGLKRISQTLSFDFSRA